MSEPQSKPSFSRRRKWTIGLQAGFIIVVVLFVVAMVNYLGGDYFHRFHWSTRAKNELSPQTVSFVQSLTNHIKATIYYDREEPFFSTVLALLREYQYVNRRITIETVDYLRDPAAALRIKAQYKLLFPTATNLVIFDCAGRTYGVDGNALTRYTLEQDPNEKERVFQRKAVAFEGEKRFTAALLAVSNPKPLTAYFLEGHGEHSIMSTDTNTGYSTFADLARQNYVQPQQLHSLLGSNAIPGDCNLLVIPGPTSPLHEIELEKIDHWLSQGGRLLVLFNLGSVGKTTGLEKILAKWGVAVGNSRVRDPGHSTDDKRSDDLVVGAFGTHPLVSPLVGLDWRLHVFGPRSIGKLKGREQAADAPRVEEIAFSSEDAYAQGDEEHKGMLPLMATVEKGDMRGIIAGSTRMLVTGDSFFLANQMFESAANRDFAGYAINWLLDRAQLLEGVGPQPVSRYRLIITSGQMTKAQWILLGGMPGTALLLGGLVWLRRRK